MTCDFEALMVEGLVYGFAERLAAAWLASDHVETARISSEIESNYGRTALNHIGELAVVIAANS